MKTKYSPPRKEKQGKRKVYTLTVSLAGSPVRLVRLLESLQNAIRRPSRREAEVAELRLDPLGRLILHDNTIEVATASSAGITILGSGSIRYNTLIVRKNIIRDVNWSAVNSIVGIDVSYGTDVNIENNLINNTSVANGVKRANNTNQRIENNRNTAGALVQ